MKATIRFEGVHAFLDDFAGLASVARTGAGSPSGD